VAADAREARLDLVGDAEAAGLPHRVVGEWQVAWRHLDDPTNALRLGPAKKKASRSARVISTCALLS
jgi:hypothetical protein